MIVFECINDNIIPIASHQVKPYLLRWCANCTYFKTGCFYGKYPAPKCRSSDYNNPYNYNMFNKIINL